MPTDDVRVERYARKTRRGITGVQRHVRHPRRHRQLVGGEEEPVILYYPPAELERQRRLDENIAAAITAATEPNDIPMEEPGVREYIDDQRRKLFRLRRGLPI